MKLPIKINPFELCEQGVLLKGTVPLEELTQLIDLLSDTVGEVAVVLEFNYDKHRHFVQGKITSVLNITCQRCGKPISYDINLEPRLCPVVDEGAVSPNLPSGWEPLLVTDGSVLLKDIITEEILLSLPMIPKHEQEDCLKKVI